jgi:DNA polymerase elongation subunit (family B)
LYIPYLQINHLTKEQGLAAKRTISPIGSFSMKINSPEYYNAIKDYNITINKGFLFEANDIFSKYVGDLFLLRQQYSKIDPMNYIAKLLLNSLYGRFGMNPIKNTQGFYSKEDFFKISKDFNIIEYVNFLDDNKELSVYVNFENPTILDKETNVSISIASAITSYARIFMAEFKREGYNLYYTDTDSIYIPYELPKNLISDKILGKFKLEYIFKDIVFLAPKVYAGITINNEYICKIKGYKNPNLIPFNDFKKLLNINEKLKIYHTK